MDLNLFASLLSQLLAAHREWSAQWHAYEPDPSLQVSEERLRGAIAEYGARLRDTYPFFHPSYAGQMLKPPHPAAAAAYAAAMLVNSNNHALDGGPATGAMEKEVTAELAAFFGWPEALGHLTSSGTIANLEALWVARELHPGSAIAFSSQAHYTHGRMCDVLGVRAVEVPADEYGRMNLSALRALCLSENIGTVVATIGTTSIGALDPLADLVALRNELGFRIHADAAYGGFFRLLAMAPQPLVPAAAFLALPDADSIVVDPHKHGLQPYGCGCVLFRDPSVGRFYRHDSPYTYFTSRELHLGEISLECSRPGAAAAALWFTLRCVPLAHDEGFGPILRACREAALAWAGLLRTSADLSLLLEPELDIVSFFPAASTSAQGISRLTDRIFESCMNDSDEPVYLAKLRVPVALLRARYPDVAADAEQVTVLRSTLMKPEHRGYVPLLHQRVERAAREAASE
jgi:glutamate/tyrosine decarboxylase-like PLP-dependent enzyme